MIEKIILDMLTQDSVSVIRQNYIDYSGQLYPIGQPHRKAYVNDANGRIEVQNEIPIVQQNAIFAVWGETPTL